MFVTMKRRELPSRAVLCRLEGESTCLAEERIQDGTGENVCSRLLFACRMHGSSEWVTLEVGSGKIPSMTLGIGIWNGVK